MLMHRWLTHLLLLFTVSAFGQDLPAYQFQDKVHAVTEHSFKAKSRHGQVENGKPAHEFTWQHDYTAVYDSTGHPTHLNLLSKSGEILLITDYIFDDKGLLQEQNSYDADGHPRPSYWCITEYDDAGRLRRRTIHFHPKETTRVYDYQYTRDGRIVETRQHPSGDTLLDLPSREFDSTWQLTKQWFYSPSGKLLSWHECQYDSRRLKSSELVYNAKHETILQYHWRYDEQNNITRFEECGTSSANCVAWTYKYEFDAKHNWIRCVEYRNGKPAFIKEREIVYF